MAQALLEAARELEKLFWKARRHLNLFQFWDSEGDEELFGRVLVKDYPEITFELLDQFLEAWLSRIPGDVHPKLTFKINREDDYPV